MSFLHQQGDPQGRKRQIEVEEIHVKSPLHDGVHLTIEIYISEYFILICIKKGRANYSLYRLGFKVIGVLSAVLRKKVR